MFSIVLVLQEAAASALTDLANSTYPTSRRSCIYMSVHTLESNWSVLALRLPIIEIERISLSQPSLTCFFAPLVTTHTFYTICHVRISAHRIEVLTTDRLNIWNCVRIVRTVTQPYFVLQSFLWIIRLCFVWSVSCSWRAIIKIVQPCTLDYQAQNRRM